MNTTIIITQKERQFSLPGEDVTLSSNTSVSMSQDNDMAKFWIQGILLMVVGVFGFVGNIAGMIHFSSKEIYKRKFEALMFWLALWDNVFIFSATMGYSIPEGLQYFTFDTGEYFAYTVPWLLPIAQSAITCNILFTMAVSIERYFAICKPLFHRANQRYNSSARYIISIIVFSVIYNLTKFFEYETVVVSNVDTEGKFH